MLMTSMHLNRWSEVFWWFETREGVIVWVTWASPKEKLHCGQSRGRKSKVFIDSLCVASWICKESENMVLLMW